MVSNSVMGSPTQKLIQIKFPAGLSKVTLTYRDTLFTERFLTFSNEALKDTLISVKANLSTGDILCYAVIDQLNGKYFLIKQSFILPDTDTLKLTINSDHRLLQADSQRFFIEDIVDYYFEFPTNDKSFVDKETGRAKIVSIFKKNEDSIKRKLDSGKIAQPTADILREIAKADYYYRKISWALNNNSIIDIKDDISDLNHAKIKLQKIRTTSITQLFATYVNYIIQSEHLNTENPQEVVKAIIDKGWSKNITIGYLKQALPGLKSDNRLLDSTLADLDNYAGKDFSQEIKSLKKRVAPMLTNLDKALLIKPDGKQTSLQMVLNSCEKQFVLIDFWASWCKPCREEVPFFEKARRDPSLSHIMFVSISTDDDKKINTWKQALKEDGAFNKGNQYKLIQPKQSPLFEKFLLGSIPRYLLINAEGKIIDKNFIRPSDPEFKSSLLRFQKASSDL